MNRTKFYKITIGCLLALNALVLALLICSNSYPWFGNSKQGNNFQEELIKVLNLDDSQVLKFNVLAEKHEKRIRDINERDQRLLRTYFENIAHADVLKDSIEIERSLDRSMVLQREKLKLTRQHFLDIKNLLHDRQLDDFNELMDRVVGRIVGKNNKRRRPPKDLR